MVISLRTKLIIRYSLQTTLIRNALLRDLVIKDKDTVLFMDLAMMDFLFTDLINRETQWLCHVGRNETSARHHLSVAPQGQDRVC